MRSDIKKFIKECEACQRNKSENTHSAGLLQPLPIPTKVWIDISLDLIEGLPSSGGYSVIMVVVDRLSKCLFYTSFPHTQHLRLPKFLLQMFSSYMACPVQL